MRPQVKRPSYFWLYLGLSFTAVALGYMVGASNSPVVGSVIPGVFGLVVVAIGVFKDLGHRTDVEDRNSAPKERDGSTPLSFDSIRSLGIMLTVFAISYFGAAILGTEVRALTSRPASTQFPWTEKNRPTKTTTALEWLVVQKRLVAYGYTLDQVRQLYEWSQSVPAQDKVGASLDFSPKLIDSVPEPGPTV